MSPNPLMNILISVLLKKIELVKQCSLKIYTYKSDKLFSQYQRQDLVHRLKWPDRNVYL